MVPKMTSGIALAITNRRWNTGAISSAVNAQAINHGPTKAEHHTPAPTAPILVQSVICRDNRNMRSMTDAAITQPKIGPMRNIVNVATRLVSPANAAHWERRCQTGAAIHAIGDSAISSVIVTMPHAILSDLTFALYRECVARMARPPTTATLQAAPQSGEGECLPLHKRPKPRSTLHWTRVRSTELSLAEVNICELTSAEAKLAELKLAGNWIDRLKTFGECRTAA